MTNTKTPTPAPTAAPQTDAAKLQALRDESDRRVVAARGTMTGIAPASAPQPMEIERRNGMWHTNCENHLGGVIREVSQEPDRSLMKCLSCGKQGYYPVGGVGLICAEEVVCAASSPQTDAERLQAITDEYDRADAAPGLLTASERMQANSTSQQWQESRDEIDRQACEAAEAHAAKKTAKAAMAALSRKPYAYEYGRSTGDGYYSVVIERGEIPAYVKPVKEWPIKPLWDSPATATSTKGATPEGAAGKAEPAALFEIFRDGWGSITSTNLELLQELPAGKYEFFTVPVPQAVTTPPRVSEQVGERALFEAEMRHRFGADETFERDNDDCYVNRSWHDALIGWKAARAITQQAAPEAPTYRALQKLENPYNERDHGPGWQVAAHAWDEAIISAMRIVGRSVAAPEAPASEHCPHCDDTGDVHRADGEWMGRCSCPYGASPAATTASDALRNIRDTAYFDSTANGAMYYCKAENALAAIEGRDAEPKPERATTASASGRDLYEAWAKSPAASDTIGRRAAPAWDDLSASTQVHWNKQAIYGCAPAPSREAAPQAPSQIKTWQERYGDARARGTGPRVPFSLTQKCMEAEIVDLRAALAAQPSASLFDDEAKRLRRVVRLMGMEREVPENDATLRGSLFSVLGQIARKLEVSQPSADLAAGGELPPLPEPDAKFYELDDFGNSVGRDTDDYTEKRMREYGAACAAAARRAAGRAPVGEAVRDGLAEKLLNAAIACGHIITDEKITLHRNPKLSGNALDQLGNRLKNRLPRAAAPSHPDEPAGEGSAK